MNSSTGVPLLYALVLETIQTHMVDLGASSLERFEQAAEVSQIPAEFVSASMNKGRDFVEIARRIFGEIFRNEDECSYAVSYANTISTLKNWNKLSSEISAKLQMLEEVRKKEIRLGLFMEDNARRLMCTLEELPDRMHSLGYITETEVELFREFSSFKSQIEEITLQTQTLNETSEKLKRLALASCGAVVQMEQYSVPPSLKNFKMWVRWWTKYLLGKKATAKDLERVRNDLENFFNSKKNRARIILASS